MVCKMNIPYRYRAIVTDVHDGDTITVNMDMGMRTWLHDIKIRFAGIDAPKLYGPGREKGLASRDFLARLIDEQDVIIDTEKDAKGRDATGKYGRWLGTVWVKAEDSDEWINVNARLVEEGLAVIWRGRK